MLEAEGPILGFLLSVTLGFPLELGTELEGAIPEGVECVDNETVGYCLEEEAKVLALGIKFVVEEPLGILPDSIELGPLGMTLSPS